VPWGSSSSSASVAVNGFVIDATRKTASSEQPVEKVSICPPAEIPTASAGTSHSIAAASQACEYVESSTIRYPTGRPGLGRARLPSRRSLRLKGLPAPG